MNDQSPITKLVVPVLLLGLVQTTGLAASKKATVLFTGKDLTGWQAPTSDWMAVKGVRLDPADPQKFLYITGEGVLLNGSNGHTGNLMTEANFGDVQAHIEFCIPKHSNSGVYLMGRYEIQIYDSYGVEKKDHYPGIECGGIYPRWINEKNVEG